MPTHATPEHDLQQQQDAMQSAQEQPPLRMDQALEGKTKHSPKRVAARQAKSQEIRKQYEENTLQTEAKKLANKLGIEEASITKEGELSLADRLMLYAKLSRYASYAYTNFVDVANQLYAETKAKKAADAALTASLINIAMVWITPGVSNALEGLATILEKSSKHAAFVAAYHLLDKKDKIAASLVGIPKDQIIRNVGATEPNKDLHKNFIDGAKKGFLSTTEQFMGKIEPLIKNPKKLSDAQLLAITARWNPNVLSASALKARLKQQMDIWEKNVAPIGEAESIRGNNALEAHKTTGMRAKGLVWALQNQGSAYLCMVEASIQRNGETPSYRFLRFIPESMKEMAIQKAEAQPHQAAGISYRRPNEIQGYPTAKPPKNAAKQ